MNLQQLNQSGQSMWSFFVTLTVALLVTGCVWFSLALYNTVAVWNRKNEEQRPWFKKEIDKGPRRTLTDRVALFFGLVGPSYDD